MNYECKDCFNRIPAVLPATKQLFTINWISVGTLTSWLLNVLLYRSSKEQWIIRKMKIPSAISRITFSFIFENFFDDCCGSFSSIFFWIIKRSFRSKFLRNFFEKCFEKFRWKFIWEFFWGFLRKFLWK